MTTAGETERSTPDAAQAPAEEVPTGPAAAVVLAAGIGAVVLGLCTTLAEASSGIKDGLQWNDRVGPLSGKTIIAAGVFFLAWGALAAIWRGKNPPLRKVLIVSAVLIALGLLGTFPIFFQAFADE